ncbi:hypothetical protein E2C01_063984 [Portunus trituberculatus]|uniref:Uncharacterized protein n=1 Tax=Portunus trituberculatus TaxID=210409 RepID=A0A5B7HHW8_PORTR|nr:hypothetical protein [Portunus trituberculatus]
MPYTSSYTPLAAGSEGGEGKEGIGRRQKGKTFEDGLRWGEWWVGEGIQCKRGVNIWVAGVGSSGGEGMEEWVGGRKVRRNIFGLEWVKKRQVYRKKQ